MALFEPDGRNDIQSVGHWAVTLLNYLCYVLAVIFLTPAITYVWVHRSIQIQKAAVDTFRAHAPVEVLVMDLNTPTFTPDDILAVEKIQAANAAAVASVVKRDPVTHQVVPFDNDEEADAAIASAKTTPLPLTSLPFSFKTWVNPSKDPDFGSITPQWVNTHLSIAADVVDDKDLEGPQGGEMATTRMWDWGGKGMDLLRARCVPNRIAYVSANRAAARMRLFVTAYKLGWDLKDLLTAEGQTQARNMVSSQALAATFTYHLTHEGRMPVADAARFTQVYNHLFTGRLPVVVLHLQKLGDYKLEDYDTLNHWAPPGSELREDILGFPGNAPGPYITGMTLGSKIRFDGGHPEFSYLDYFVRSAPCVDSAPQKADDALNAMTTFNFWRPLLVAEGITSDQDLQAARDALAELGDEVTAEIHAAKIKLRSINDRF